MEPEPREWKKIQLGRVFLRGEEPSSGEGVPEGALPNVAFKGFVDPDRPNAIQHSCMEPKEEESIAVGAVVQHSDLKPRQACGRDDLSVFRDVRLSLSVGLKSQPRPHAAYKGISYRLLLDKAIYEVPDLRMRINKPS